MTKSPTIDLLFDQAFTLTASPIYFLDDNGNEFLTFEAKGRKETLKIRSTPCKSMIRVFIMDNNLGNPKSHLVESIQEQMLSKAYMSKATKTVFVRSGIAENGDVIIDLEKNGYCRISPGRYQILESVDVPFWRPAKMRLLPLPEKISLIDFEKLFRSKLNLVRDDNYLLLLAFIVKSLLVNRGDYPILVFQGDQGSAKTSNSNNLKKLIDPTVPLSNSLPKDTNDLIVLAISSLLLVFDNQSGLSGQKADEFCRLSTGGGISKRALYTDDSEKSYLLTRPVIFNGIDDLTVRPDFMERTIVIHLKTISEMNRKSQMFLEAEFDRDYGKLIGGIFELISKVLEILPDVNTPGLPRMTEYARTGIAIERALNLRKGTFLSVYKENSNEKDESTFWNDEICNAIFNHLEGSSTPLEGTMAQIKKTLTHQIRKAGVKLPETVKGFSGHLKRVSPTLKSKGIIVEKLGRSSSGTKYRIDYDGVTPFFQDEVINSL